MGSACSMLRYDTRCYFNVRSKADMSHELNLPHGTSDAMVAYTVQEVRYFTYVTP